MSEATFISEESWEEPPRAYGATLGMWVFLATEILFFGALFFTYAILRSRNPEAFAEAGRHAEFLYGTVNTGLLMTSGFGMAIAVGANTHNDRSALRFGLIAAMTLGAAFLIVKGLEYRQDIVNHLVPGPGFPIEPAAAQSFFSLYWVMTGLHALHMIVGIALLARVYGIARRAALPENFDRTLFVCALYWNFVDVVWVSLYPLFYLVGRS